MKTEQIPPETFPQPTTPVKYETSEATRGRQNALLWSFQGNPFDPTKKVELSPKDRDTLLQKIKNNEEAACLWYKNNVRETLDVERSEQEEVVLSRKEIAGEILKNDPLKKMLAVYLDRDLKQLEEVTMEDVFALKGETLSEKAKEDLKEKFSQKLSLFFRERFGEESLSARLASSQGLIEFLFSTLERMPLSGKEKKQKQYDEAWDGLLNEARIFVSNAQEVPSTFQVSEEKIHEILALSSTKNLFAYLFKTKEEELRKFMIRGFLEDCRDSEALRKKCLNEAMGRGDLTPEQYRFFSTAVETLCQLVFSQK